MNIFISGSSGFIGSHLISNLLFENYTIIGSDLKKPVSSNNKNFHFIMNDLSNNNIEEIFTKFRIDVIIHLAQSVNYKLFPDGAVDMTNVNIKSTVNLLDLAYKFKIKKFVFASTGSIYKRSESKVSEDAEIQLNSMYTATKYAAELLVTQYASFFEVFILRFFGVYGPGQKSMLIPDIYNRINNSEKITLASKKGLVYTPIYISDVVNIIRKLLSYKSDSNPSILNVCGDQIINLKQIVDLICNLMNKSVDVTTTTDKPNYLIGDNNKLKKHLNYSNFRSIDFGIKEFILKANEK